MGNINNPSSEPSPPECSICRHLRPGPGGWRLFPHYGWQHVCEGCWPTFDRWRTITEQELVATGLAPSVITDCFWFVNQRRRIAQQRLRAKRTRASQSGLKARGQTRIPPALRRSAMLALGHDVMKYYGYAAKRKLK